MMQCLEARAAAAARTAARCERHGSRHIDVTKDDTDPAVRSPREKLLGPTMQYKNSSGDEIANVNFYDDMARTYFKILKKRTYFV